MVIVIWFSTRSEKTVRAGRSASEPTNAATVSVANQAAPAPLANQTGVTGAASSAPPSARKSKEQQMAEILSTENDVPIVFYGKLEDQFGNPVAGARITGNTIIYDGVKEGVARFIATSDTAGFFKFDAGKGESFGVMPSKEGYALATTGTEFKYSHLYDGYHVPDQNNPAIIKMWKLQGAEPLLMINQRHKFNYKGVPVNFDLLAGQIVQSGGDIKITVERAEGVLSARNRQNWSLKIEASDGGITDSSGQEAMTYWAPETGYEPYVLLTFSTNAPYKWADGFTKGFFVKSRTGQIYSKLGISFHINRNPDDPMDITFSGIANTNGSRNWEGDPNTYKP